MGSRMLSKANLAIVAALGFAAATIYLVHHSQSADRKVSESSKALTYATSTSSLTFLVRINTPKHSGCEWAWKEISSAREERRIM